MSLALDGVLVVDKPEGITSHDVVASVRRRLPRGTRVGHTGTLDPLATGVLPLVIGRATRLAQFLTASRKTYLAELAFGCETDTCDRTGAVIDRVAPQRAAALTEAVLADALATLLGTHPQVPPTHSAKKVDGERAYVLARQGASVTLPAVAVTAHALALQAWDAPRHVAVVCLDTSAGYYVRSFARDLGRRVGVPAHLAALRRTASGTFTIGDAHPLQDVVQAGADQLRTWRLPMERLLPELPALTLDDRQVDAVLHGQPVAGGAEFPTGTTEGRVRLLDAAGALVALARRVGVDEGDAAHVLHADIVLR